MHLYKALSATVIAAAVVAMCIFFINEPTTHALIIDDVPSVKEPTETSQVLYPSPSQPRTETTSDLQPEINDKLILEQKYYQEDYAKLPPYPDNPEQGLTGVDVNRDVTTSLEPHFLQGEMI